MNDLEGGCSDAEEAPGALDLGQLGSGLADAEAQGEFAVQLGVREVKIAAVVEAIHEGLVGGVAGAMAEADKIQRSGRGQLELAIALAIVADPGGESLGEFDVAANVMLQTFDAVVANHKP